MSSKSPYRQIELFQIPFALGLQKPHRGEHLVMRLRTQRQIIKGLLQPLKLEHNLELADRQVFPLHEASLPELGEHTLPDVLLVLSENVGDRLRKRFSSC